MYKKNAFTLVEILIIVAILGLLAGIAVPNLMKAREGAEENACKGNMAMIEAAIEQWALDEHKTSGTTIVSGAQTGGWYDYLRDGLPDCPTGGVYSYPKRSGTTGGTVGDYKVVCTKH